MTDKPQTANLKPVRNGPKNALGFNTITGFEEQPVEVEIGHLSAVQKALEAMTRDGRKRAFGWLKSKFANEWPHDPQY